MTVTAFNEQPVKKTHLQEKEPISATGAAGLAKHLRFHDLGLAERFAKGKVPMAHLYEAYFDGRVDLVSDIYEFLAERDRYVKYSITGYHWTWLFSNFIPETAVHTKSQDQRIIREHYDRGNDFFSFFLGDPMVYTAGYYKNGQGKHTLDEAQYEKINRVARKLMLKPGETLLDVGCGWGTLARNTARDFGVDVTGVTLSKRQTELGMERIKKAGVEDRARILCCDYRDTPKKKFNKIVSLEMVEHVGVKNLPKFFEQMWNQLDDDGHFLLQWTGLRRGGDEGVPIIGLRPEDLSWGLFMAKYIFPGADASLPCSEMIKYAERAKFEVFSVENVSQHYGFTLKAWHDNWVSNKEKVLATYGERWYRIWNFFLAWSVQIGDQGNAACYQVVFNKNVNNFNRRVYINNGSKNHIPGVD